MTNALLSAALEYAALGWQVLPVGGDDGKRPLIKHGLNAASSDPEQIRAWWAKWPTANIAIATGAPGPDVLDVDDPANADDRALTIDAPRVATQRGEHFYFTGTENRTVKLPYGELRRKGSYVIAPPSVRPDTGHRYAWINADHGRPTAPEWLTAGRSTAGTGIAEPVERVGRGDMYDHLLDLAVRLARAGLLDGAQRERILRDEFDRVREPGVEYGGGPDDTRRLAYAATDILEREQNSRAGALPSPPPTGEGRGALNFLTPAELRENLPSEPEWVWDGNLAQGFITVVGGRPKVGKSTVVYEALDRLVRGEESFLGGKLHPTDVVLVSEEHAVTALNKLSDSPRLHVITRDAAWPLPEWPKLIAAGLAEAQRTDARLLLIDSFTFWAQLGPDAAQDAGAVQAAVAPLVAVAREGIGVLLIHHQRKGGGEFGDALLGSTAFAANADIILEVERLEEGAPSHYRRIMRVGRWYLPPVLIASWTPDNGYQLVAEAESMDDAEDHIWEERLLGDRGVLRPWGVSKRATELGDLLGDTRKWARAMSDLIARGAVVKTGVGGVKDPITYTSVAPDDRPEQPDI